MVLLLLGVFLATNIVGGIKVKAVSSLEIIEKYKKDIIASSRKTGVWASVAAAQLILESGAEMSELALEHNNLFGLKWAEVHAERYPGAKPVDMATKEDYGNGQESVIGAFTHFPSITDSITEHSIIWWNGYYSTELKILQDLDSEMDEFLRAVGNGKYATDRDYYSKLRKVIDSNNLEDLDKIAFPEGRKFCGFGDSRVGEYKYPDDGFNGSASDVGSNRVDSKNGQSYVVVAEEDLKGMYPTSFFSSKAGRIGLPSYDGLNIKEKINLDTLKNNINEQNSWSLWDTLRVFTVFTGLCTLIYAVMFIVGYLFDKSNNIIEISLISLMTFGHLKFSEEDYEIKGYVNKSKLIKVEGVLFLLGFFLVGGGLFSFIIDLIYYTKNIFG